ncbi:MAG: nucleotidyltransferase domain-containing protein [Methanophagales archaeon]|nr:nucleotidyltransferase domain-containing protein [Methanophagales archaeon]
MMKIYAIGKAKKEEVQRRIVDILKERREILFAYLHGSFFEGSFRDVDVAVYMGEEKSKREVLKCELELERELEEVVGFPTDVRILNHAPLCFKFKVIERGVLLFSKDERYRCDFESLTMVEYHDFNFHREIYRRVALGIEV